MLLSSETMVYTRKWTFEKSGYSQFFLTLMRLFTYCNKTLRDAPFGLIGNPVKIGSGPAAVIGDERRN